MNIEFKPEESEISVTEHIVLNGRTIGKMYTYPERNGGSRYHAAIDIKGGHIGLTQGHGESKEAAVLAALTKGRNEAETELVSIAELEAELNSEK